MICTSNSLQRFIVIYYFHRQFPMKNLIFLSLCLVVFGYQIHNTLGMAPNKHCFHGNKCYVDKDCGRKIVDGLMIIGECVMGDYQPLYGYVNFAIKSSYHTFLGEILRHLRLFTAKGCTSISQIQKCSTYSCF